MLESFIQTTFKDSTVYDTAKHFGLTGRYLGGTLDTGRQSARAYQNKTYRASPENIVGFQTFHGEPVIVIELFLGC